MKIPLKDPPQPGMLHKDKLADHQIERRKMSLLLRVEDATEAIERSKEGSPSSPKIKCKKYTKLLSMRVGPRYL